MSEIDQQKLQVVLVDDEVLARQGLSMRLSKFSQIEIVAQCQNGRDALDAIVEHEPDLVFVDIQMPAKFKLIFCRCLFLSLPMIHLL